MIRLPKNMFCVEVKRPGGPEVLVESETELPRCKANEILIKVHAAGINRPDCLQRAGLYPVPPDASPLPGLEVAGEVVGIGDGTSEWKLGERVVALTHGGGYAEYCTAHEGHCLPWPTNLSAEEAATLPETCFTVHHNLLDRGRLLNKQTVLIHGGSSGIGTTAIQVAKIFGAKIIATAGSVEKCDYCLSIGANHVINYKVDDFEMVVKDLVGPNRVDVVLDMVAGDYVKKNIRLLAMDGRYVMIAFLGGAQTEVNFGHVLGKRISILGSTLRPQSISNKAAIAENVLDDIWPHVISGKIKSHVFKTYPLSSARDAHILMESSKHMGKIALKVLRE